MYSKIKNIVPHKIRFDNFSARLLEKNQDLDLVENFFRHNKDYYENNSTMKSDKKSGEFIFNFIPANKTIEDKFIIGLFDNNSLIALFNLIQNFQEENQWTMGEFAIDLDYRHKGIGNKLLKGIEELLLTLRVNSLIMFVNQNNSAGVKFLTKNSFTEVRRAPDGDIMMIKKLEKKEPTIYDKFFKNGKLVSLPSKPSEQQELYKIMQSWFEKGRKYTEPEINNIIKSKIEHSDHATIRRNLVDTCFLKRSTDGKEYYIN